MTKPRRKPNIRFLAFLVEPEPGFQPTNWQQNPEHYRILEFVGPKHFKGRADAWKFLHNHDQMKFETKQKWAIYLDLDSPIFGTERADENSHSISIRRQNLFPANHVASPINDGSCPSLRKSAANSGRRNPIISN